MQANIYLKSLSTNIAKTDNFYFDGDIVLKTYYKNLEFYAGFNEIEFYPDDFNIGIIVSLVTDNDPLFLTVLDFTITKDLNQDTKNYLQIVKTYFEQII